MNKSYRYLAAMVVVVLLLGAARPAPRAYAQVPAAPSALRLLMVDQPFTDWTVGGFFIYWAVCGTGPAAPAAESAAAAGYLRRLPAGFGRIAYMSGDSFCGKQLAADDSGLYAYMDNGDIVKRLVSNQYVSTLVHHTTDAPIRPLVLSGGFVYWISPTHIYRVNQDGSGAITVASTHGAPASNLVVLSDGVVWLADGGLWMAATDCAVLPCGEEKRLISANGSSLVRYEGGVIWRDHTTSPQSIHRMDFVTLCFHFDACNTTPVYEADDSASFIGAMALSGSQLFFVENECTPDVCLPTASGRMRRTSVDGGGGTTIWEDIPNFGDKLYVDSHYVYYENSPPGDRRLIARIPRDAPALQHSLKANGWEITQGIQRLTNDVPLVANKPTFVRVYGLQLAGQRANTVEAAVYGWANGGPLAGSPLWPMEGRSRSLATGQGYDRLNAGDGWLFQLPDAWTNAGALTLQVRLDPRGVYEDPDLSDNGLPNAAYPATTFNFIGKTVVCVVTLPVRTNGPVPDANSAGYWDSIGVVKRLWPTSQVWTYRQTDDVAEREFNPFPIFGPYELPDDQEGLLTTLAMRDMFSDDPDECDNINARTHYIGLVSPGTPTGVALGAARRGNDQAWVKLPPPGTDPASLAQSLTVLAHELGHDYDRKHVNCGGPTGLDTFYPYPPCQLDFTGPTNHFGFDSLYLEPVNPTLNGDLMSYAQTIWISDYTWRGLLQDMPFPDAPSGGLAPDLASAGEAYFVNGSVSPDQNQGSLEPAWAYPVASLGAGILAKWQAVAAPAAQAPGAAAPDVHNYHVRLLDAANAVLADQAVTPNTADDGPGTTAGFALTFPAPAGTPTRVELLDGSTVLAVLQPGSHAPTVNVTQPAGGAVVQNDLTVSWQAADADAGDMLYHTIQYSPDGGLTWRALVTNYPHAGAGTLNLTLHLAGLPGNTSEALIRVATSDGLHTTLATSQPFQVANHAPEPAIFSPALGQAVQAGQPILLQGAATDPEDGGLPDGSLSWTLDGAPLGTGSELSLAGLAPGTYTVTLTARDAQNLQQSTSASLMVGVLSVPLGGAPALDGECDDDAYAGAAQVQLAPFVDGSHGTVRLTRTGTDLWLCFSGLPRSTGELTARAGLHLDANNSRDALLQTGDYDFYVGEDGTPVSNAGDGLGNFSNPGPAGMSARTSANDVVWSAELRVPAALLGGWGHVVGMDLGEYWVQAFSDDYHWPHDAGWNQPNTWARVALGDTPWITSLSPAAADAGSGAFQLTVNGTGFASGATVRWNGSARTTTFISSTELRAQISAADVAAAGLRPVTVVNPGLAAAPSNPAWFAVQAPVQAPAVYTLFLPMLRR